MTRRAMAAAALLFRSIASGQKRDFDFYPDFRNVFTPKARAGNPSITGGEILRQYAASLRAGKVPEIEIERRLGLIRDHRPALEIDMWNRVYTGPEPEFNQAPNAFLMQKAAGLKPGVALDYAMGEGRNAIYLAQLGWEVWGFDQADAAVRIAQQRAEKLGLRLHTSAVKDADYDFGRERFDLILFSWAMPLVPVERVVGSLKPGGVVVMECAADYVGRNGMLKMFDSLEITQYERIKAKADWYNRMETEVVRLVAVKTR